MAGPSAGPAGPRPAELLRVGSRVRPAGLLRVRPVARHCAPVYTTP
ncbi:hypothetical protein ACFVYP_13980 [Kitasatospora sp. NPDC058201]|nr:hypothetical protein [Streptomyces sp. BE303]MED7947897.1 hypothetical protein [Streptomyces sp. BE303]